LKLRHALDAMAMSVQGLICADFGCSTGGFTDCLLQGGADRVYAIDTGYGVLAWKLRQDPRVVVMERQNALHAPVPPEVTAAGGLDLVVIDAGWTPQRLVIPAAVKWLKPAGRIITLVKPHYELEPAEKGLLRAGVLPDAEAERIAHRTIDALPAAGVRVLGVTESPIRGGHATKAGAGNREWLAALARD
jgi:23S rRNA (cytidine1920-2'-O)/16S rRNA (cytidine1409-2'-O)-methyltransferase